MQKVEAFKTTDGEIFMDASKAAQHQASLDNQSSINEFLKSDFNSYKKGASLSISITAIQRWEYFKANKDVPEESEQLAA